MSGIVLKIYFQITKYKTATNALSCFKTTKIPLETFYSIVCVQNSRNQLSIVLIPLLPSQIFKYFRVRQTSITVSCSQNFQFPFSTISYRLNRNRIHRRARPNPLRCAVILNLRGCSKADIRKANLIIKNNDFLSTATFNWYIFHVV